jgi:hypothetical protein
MPKSFGVVTIFVGTVLAQAQGHLPDHHTSESSLPSAAAIKIVINPETRVSVYRGNNIPGEAICGRPLPLLVKIVNQSFMTAPLKASLVGSVPDGVRVDFPAEPLKGTREEYRILRIMLTQRAPVDVTIAFRAEKDIPDLGGRDRIHLLLKCT